MFADQWTHFVLDQDGKHFAYLTGVVAAVAPVKTMVVIQEILIMTLQNKLIHNIFLTIAYFVSPIPGVGVTIAPFVNLSVRIYSRPGKLLVRFLKSHS